MALSKIIQLVLVKTVPTMIIEQWNEVKKEWNILKPKVKNSVLCCGYKDRALKMLM